MICSSLEPDSGFTGPREVGSIYALVSTHSDPSGPCNPHLAGLVYLIAANDYITCDETLPPVLLGAGGGGSCGPHRPTFELCIPVPESQLTPSTIDLGKSPYGGKIVDVNCNGWAVGPGCDIGGSSYLEEGPGVTTLTIETVDPSSVTFSIDYTLGGFGSGQYTAQRCP